MGLLSNENAISASGYQIANSLRFQSASSQYLSRTFGTATSRTTFTLNQWVKRGSLGSYQFFFDGGGSEDYIGFTNSDTIRVLLNGSTIAIETSQVFRDPSAWYNILFVVDSTQATASNRMKLYINGVQVTAFGTTNYPAQNATFNFNSATSHKIGSNFATNNYFLDGYDTEIVFVDGQALTPSSFGSTDATSGQWVAAKYTGTYGTNGFYLPFSNGTSTTTLGADSSGNSNNWTLTNFTRSAGASDCWMTDVPSGNSSTGGNYATLNPLNFNTGLTTISNANLQATLGNASNWRSVAGTILPSSGLFYTEFVVSSSANDFMGVALATSTVLNNGATSIYGYTSDSWSFNTGGQKYNNSTGAAYGSAASAGNIIGVALDLTYGAIYFSINNVWQNSGVPTSGASKTGAAFSLTTGVPYMIGSSCVNGATTIVNFGQRSFAYTPPSGFKALCTANLPVATIKQGNKYMDATLYSGNLVGQAITNAASFQPDLVWVKSRSAATDNKLTDSVRGATKALISNTTGAETTDVTGVVSFNSNGFTLGTSTTYNNTGATYVGWQWQAGQGSSSSNTNGSITSTVSVNATAGFSVVTYTGTGANATVGHGLGVAPKMVIVKKRSAAGNWATYHSNLTSATYVVYMNLTNAQASSAASWNSTAPTSSVFSIGTDSDVNVNTATFIAYCFAEIAGFNKFGSYTGNGSTDGSFIYTGFRPKLVMTKRIDTTSDWVMIDTSRNPYNVSNARLYPDLSAAEDTGDTMADIVSNGFKLRTTNVTENANGGTYIYMAFAENPFAQANAR